MVQCITQKVHFKNRCCDNLINSNLFYVNQITFDVTMRIKTSKAQK